MERTALFPIKYLRSIGVKEFLLSHSTPLALRRGAGGEAFSLFTFHSSLGTGLGLIQFFPSNILNRSFELADAELKVQLVAEGSLSTWRRLGVAMAKVRRVNDEGSPFQ